MIARRNTGRAPLSTDFPLSPSDLEQYRVQAGKRLPASLVGAHTRRQPGRSLEFHEFRHYALGDDIRDIDWRASARLTRAEDYIVRSFVAEQSVRLVLSLDLRATMHHPAPIPKLVIGRWLVRALASIAGASGDRVLIHDLFAPADKGSKHGNVLPVAGREAGAQADKVVKRWIDRGAEGPLALAPLKPMLAPTAIWVIITDLYFEDAPPFPFQSTLSRVQDGYRWIILVELDSWPLERAWLCDGPTLAEPPRRRPEPGSTVDDRRIELDCAEADRVGARITEHTRSQWQRARRGGLSHSLWHWPSDVAADPSRFFRQRLFADPTLRRIFRRGR